MPKTPSILLKLASNRSLQVITLIVLYLLSSPYLPLETHRAFYAISVMIKDILLWVLPLTVTFFIAHAIVSFEKRAPLFILTLFLFEFVSNTFSVWYGYGAGRLVAWEISDFSRTPINDTFCVLWRLPQVKPLWWSADKGSFVGLVLGLASSFLFPYLKQFISQGKEVAELVLTRFFSRLIPLFILGFVARMNKTNILQDIFSNYFTIIGWLILFLFIYIAMLFLIGSGFKFRIFLKSVKNLLGAWAIAFSSGCSLSTMPWTIKGTAKNLENPHLAKAIIPATTNIQQIGDCLTNSFLCFLIYTYFNGHIPEPSLWLKFSSVFVLARFATAAVIGGAIFVMLPIYENYLGFNPEMIALILALNVVLDPIVTSSNVIANGALCRIFEKTWKVVSKKSPS